MYVLITIQRPEVALWCWGTFPSIKDAMDNAAYYHSLTGHRYAVRAASMYKQGA